MKKKKRKKKIGINFLNFKKKIKNGSIKKYVYNVIYTKLENLTNGKPILRFCDSLM